jgi:hypothetical protein
MTESRTLTLTEAFTIIGARYIASKVATDLERFRRFYGCPSSDKIALYEAELIALLKDDYLDHITYGFKRDGKWIEPIRYHALSGGMLMGNDDPGKLRYNDKVPGAEFGSSLVKNSRWNKLPQRDQEVYLAALPIQRENAAETPLAFGRWEQDHNYSAQGRGIARSRIIY